jgi:hypothetical protein
MGHQPGKGKRTDHAAAPETQDAMTMVATKRRSLVSRDMGSEGWGSRPFKTLQPALSFTTADQSGEKSSN